MIHLIDSHLREQARRFRLVFACPDCAHFDPQADRCSLGYPAEVHKSAILEDRNEVVFCKLFELT